MAWHAKGKDKSEEYTQTIRSIHAVSGVDEEAFGASPWKRVRSRPILMASKTKQRARPTPPTDSEESDWGETWAGRGKATGSAEQ